MTRGIGGTTRPPSEDVTLQAAALRRLARAAGRPGSALPRAGRSLRGMLAFFAGEPEVAERAAARRRRRSRTPGSGRLCDAPGRQCAENDGDLDADARGRRRRAPRSSRPSATAGGWPPRWRRGPSCGTVRRRPRRRGRRPTRGRGSTSGELGRATTDEVFIDCAWPTCGCGAATSTGPGARSTRPRRARATPCGVRRGSLVNAGRAVMIELCASGDLDRALRSAAR